MKVSLRTDIGRIRTVNEDRAIVQHDLNGCALAVVADGMGGHQAGDVASQIAVDTIQTELQSVNPQMSAEQIETALRSAILQANANIFDAASKKESYKGMGTTVVAAIVVGRSLVIGHVGDSRAYKFTGDRIDQLTEDHSLVNELVRTGQISPEQAQTHPRRNVLLRALGTDRQVEADIRTLVWDVNDALLMCSDGLSNLVGAEQMNGILLSERELSLKSEMLVNCALEAGGDDNITVILLANELDDKTEEGGATA